MAKRLIGVDEFTGVEAWHDHDPLTDTTTIIHSGDSEPYLELNKAMQNDPDFTKQGIKREFWLYASIPPAFQVKLLIEHGIDVYNKDHAARLGAILEDPQYKFLKTTTKKHKFK